MHPHHPYQHQFFPWVKIIPVVTVAAEKPALYGSGRNHQINVKKPMLLRKESKAKNTLKNQNPQNHHNPNRQSIPLLNWHR